MMLKEKTRRVTIEHHSLDKLVVPAVFRGFLTIEDSIACTIPRASTNNSRARIMWHTTSAIAATMMPVSPRSLNKNTVALPVYELLIPNIGKEVLE
jgi:hypothetical protein